jgi:hypothetical protein
MFQQEPKWAVGLGNESGDYVYTGPFHTGAAADEYVNRLSLALDEIDGGDFDRYVHPVRLFTDTDQFFDDVVAHFQAVSA